MNESASIARCIDLCLAKRLDFAVCLPPGEDNARLFIPALGHTSADRCFFEIGPWLTPYSGRISIGGATENVATALTRLNGLPDCREYHSAAGFRLPEESTPRNNYLSEVSKVIGSCRKRGGKTVYSRVICGQASRETWAELFLSLCVAYPGTFRFLFHTQATGGWIGATPETLLDVNLADGSFSTMSFAGTRPRNTANTPWDSKNIRENRYVSDFLADKIKSLGLTAETGELETVAYGNNIEHLCRHISGKLTTTDFIPLLDAINPTPALCGTPVEDAVADINRYESHRRGCYGGFVALRDVKRFHAFVTLRCCAFSTDKFAIYAGGGITPDSAPKNEWYETEAKSLFFRRCLQKNT